MNRLSESDVRERFKIDTSECCTSCHEDLDRGMQCSTITIDGQDVDVCCGVARTFNAMDCRPVSDMTAEEAFAAILDPDNWPEENHPGTDETLAELKRKNKRLGELFRRAKRDSGNPDSKNDP